MQYANMIVSSSTIPAHSRTMTSTEIKRFAEQGRIALQQARKFRSAADADNLEEVQKECLRTAARVIEVNSREWLKLVRELSK